MISHRYECQCCKAVITTEAPDDYKSMGRVECPYCYRSAQEVSKTSVHVNELAMADRIRELETESEKLKVFMSAFKEWQDLEYVYHHCGDMDMSIEILEPLHRAKERVYELCKAKNA